MRKIIALILSIAMIMSLFVGINVMAATKETVLFTQDFESTTTDHDAGGNSSGTYPTYHYRSGGTAGNVYLNPSTSYGSGSKCVQFQPRESGQVRGTVTVDQSFFTDGKEYKLVAYARLTRDSSVQSTPLKVTVGILKGMTTGFYKDTTKSQSLSHSESEWTRIETQKISYYKNNFKEGDLSFAVEFTGAYTDTNNKDRLRIDNVSVVEVSEEAEGDPVFKGKTTVDFEDITELRKNTDYYTNVADNLPSIAQDVGGVSGNSMKLSFSSAYNRYAFCGLFDETTDIDKFYNITLKVYPETFAKANVKGIRFGVKGDAAGTSGSNSYWSTKKFFTVGENESDGKDLTVGKWNTITLNNVEIKNVTQTSSTYPSILFAVDQRDETNGIAVKAVYIDDIVITESVVTPTGPYFEGLAAAERATLDFEDAQDLVKNTDYSGGGGYNGDVTITNETTANSGSYCLKIGGRNSTNAWNYYRAKLLGVFKNANVGDAFKVSAYFKTGGENSENTTINFGVIANENNGNIVGGTKVNVSNDGWTKGEFTYIVRNLTYIDSNKVSQTVKQDELFVDQTSVANTQENVADIIYVDDLTVEPVIDANVFAHYNGNHSESGLSRMDVKLTVDDTKFASAVSPLLILAIYDADDNILCAKVIPYEKGKTKYLINNVLTGKFNERAKARLLMWDTSNDGLVHAVSSTEIYNLATGN